MHGALPQSPAVGSRLGPRRGTRAWRCRRMVQERGPSPGHARCCQRRGTAEIWLQAGNFCGRCLGGARFPRFSTATATRRQSGILPWLIGAARALRTDCRAVTTTAFAARLRAAEAPACPSAASPNSSAPFAADPGCALQVSIAGGYQRGRRLLRSSSSAAISWAERPAAAIAATTDHDVDTKVAAYNISHSCRRRFNAAVSSCNAPWHWRPLPGMTRQAGSGR